MNRFDREENIQMDNIRFNENIDNIVNEIYYIFIQRYNQGDLFPIRIKYISYTATITTPDACCCCCEREEFVNIKLNDERAKIIITELSKTIKDIYIEYTPYSSMFTFSITPSSPSIKIETKPPVLTNMKSTQTNNVEDIKENYVLV